MHGTCKYILGGKKQPREVNQGERVVLHLAEQLTNNGRNITADIFFTSLDLVRKLLENRIAYVGTVRKNKPELPLSFTTTSGRHENSTLFGFQDSVMILSYYPKKGKVVTLMSSLHSQPTVDTSRPD